MRAMITLPSGTTDILSYLTDTFPHMATWNNQLPETVHAETVLKISTNLQHILIPCEDETEVENETVYTFFDNAQDFTDYLKANWLYWSGDEDV